MEFVLTATMANYGILRITCICYIVSERCHTKPSYMPLCMDHSVKSTHHGLRFHHLNYLTDTTFDPVIHGRDKITFDCDVFGK